jgi:hypothetical protein
MSEPRRRQPSRPETETPTIIIPAQSDLFATVLTAHYLSGDDNEPSLLEAIERVIGWRIVGTHTTQPILAFSGHAPDGFHPTLPIVTITMIPRPDGGWENSAQHADITNVAEARRWVLKMAADYSKVLRKKAKAKTSTIEAA